MSRIDQGRRSKPQSWLLMADVSSEAVRPVSVEHASAKGIEVRARICALMAALLGLRRSTCTRLDTRRQLGLFRLGCRHRRHGERPSCAVASDARGPCEVRRKAGATTRRISLAWDLLSAVVQRTKFRSFVRNLVGRKGLNRQLASVRLYGVSRIDRRQSPGQLLRVLLAAVGTGPAVLLQLAAGLPIGQHDHDRFATRRAVERQARQLWFHRNSDSTPESSRRAPLTFPGDRSK